MGKLETLDIISILDFVVGLANYEENLTQSDKQDIMNEIDKTTQVTLDKLSQQLDYQNQMLSQILGIVRSDHYEKDKEVRKTN